MVQKKIEKEYMERKERVRKFFESNKLKGIKMPIDDQGYMVRNFENYIREQE